MCFSGCGPASDVERPETAAVTGSVTYNGEAVAGAVVSFSPTGEAKDGAIGTTDAQGKFTLQTQWGAKGAVPGSYAVSVTKTEGIVTSEADLAEAQIGAPESAPASEASSALPAKYGSSGTSGLTAEVSADGENNFTFELTD